MGSCHILKPCHLVKFPICLVGLGPGLPKPFSAAAFFLQGLTLDLGLEGWAGGSREVIGCGVEVFACVSIVYFTIPCLLA